MNYLQSVHYIENAKLFDAKKDGLNNIIELLKRLNNPHHSFSCIHVAGTNGKGSVCAFMESSLRCAGHKTGLFTSPYLEEFTERIRIDGENVDKDIFVKAATRVIDCAKAMKEDGYNHPTFFELVTATGFLIFKHERIDIAVIETGIGGTYDSTNVLDPILCVITSIGLDHMTMLGDTIDEIAMNKAGIIKPGCPVVVYPQPYIEAYARILSTAKDKNAPVYSLTQARIKVLSSGLDGSKFVFSYESQDAELEIKLLGTHQILNASTAFLALCVLSQQGIIKLSYDQIKQGLYDARWAGRLELVKNRPSVFIDGAHNRQGAKALVDSIKKIFPIGKVHIICGMLGKKDAFSIAKELKTIAKIIYPVRVNANNPMSVDDITEIFKSMDIECKTVGSVTETIEYVVNCAKKLGEPVIICGSLFLAGEARKHFVEKSDDLSLI